MNKRKKKQEDREHLAWRQKTWAIGRWTDEMLADTYHIDVLREAEIAIIKAYTDDELRASVRARHRWPNIAVASDRKDCVIG